MAKHSPVYGELSDVECEACGDLIPLKRLRAVKTDHCVSCAEDLEASGQGTKRHRMHYNVTSKGDEVESVDVTIIRSNK